MVRILFCFFVVLSASGQNTATLFGTVADSAGASVPGAQVTATHIQTGALRQAVTDEAGSYLFVQLPVGEYQVRAAAAGFKEFLQTGIVLQVSENRRADIALQVGQVNERIEVTAQAAAVETRSGTVSEVIDSRRIAELPLNGRNPVQLQTLIPGAGRRGGRDQQQNETVSLNGSAFRGNNYALDGGDNQDPFFNTPAPFPNPDALQEFSIETSVYSADKGRNAGAFVSAVTKSGTNEFHGTLFEYLRNEKLNARDFFAVTAPPFKRNQYGGTFGGPVRRDKLFFFGSYQGTAERSAPGVTTALVPGEAMRRGDFSSLGRVLRDPNGGNFAGNIIPASRIYQPSLKFLETFIPLPNRSDGLLSSASQQSIDDRQIIGKVDWQVSSAHRLAGRLLFNDNDTLQAVGNIPNLLASIPYTNYNGTVSDTWVVSPTTVNSITFTAQNIVRDQTAITPPNVGWKDFGTGIVRAHRENTVAATDTTVTGYWQAFTRHPLFQERYFLHLREDFSTSLSRHLLKFGGEWRYDRVNRVERFQGDPAIIFRGAAITGDPQADFMLGRPDTINQNSGAESFPTGSEISLYATDDWKMNRRLTLNLGLRWDPFLPQKDRRGTGAMFRAGQQSRYFPLAPVGLVYWSKDPPVPEKYGFGNIWTNFAPRAGFALDPTGNGKSSIRGGYGIFYGSRALQQIGGGGPGFVLATNISPVPGGLANPYSTIGGNPYPFDPPASEAARAAFRFVRPVSVGGWSEKFRNPLVQQWNLSLQRQVLNSWIVQAAYVANRGDHLETTSQVNPAVFGRPGNLQQRRIYPEFAGIGLNSSEGRSSYHSLQLSANRRYAQGLTVMASYTWAKLIDNIANPQDGLDFNNGRAIGDNNIAHRFVGSFIWEVPSPRGLARAARFVLAGWELNGIVSLESGLAYTVVSGRDNSGTGINLDRPNLVGDPVLPSNRSRRERIARYFDPAAFEQNPAGTIGNAGRNILTGPGEALVDLGLVKTFPVTERHRIRFRAEAFNAFNRVNLDNPNGNLNSPAVGRITSAGPPRVFQFALRYEF
jgi:hypothetical protein